MEGDSRPNGVSDITEFKAAALAERIRRAKPVPLPSGKIAKLVKPSGWEIMVMTGQLPQSVAAKMAPETNQMVSSSEMMAISRSIMDLISFIFVSPGVPDEARPGIEISFGDIEYAVAWARGEVTDSGQSLAEFREKRERSLAIANT